tara:strand:+ start:925 stop:1164 length:240 start_codon:yes stop_codon:yes gene_type:complete
MNKKFVKENKSVLKEFLGAAIAAMVTGAMSSKLKKQLNDDPDIKKKKQELAKITADLRKRLEKTKTRNPELYNLLKKSL